MTSEPVANFGRVIAEVLRAYLGPDLVGVYFVGSVAIGGYVPGESDLDVTSDRTIGTVHRCGITLIP